MRVMMHAVAVALICSLLQTVAANELGFAIKKYVSESVELSCTVLQGNETDIQTNVTDIVWEKKRNESDPYSEPIYSFDKFTYSEKFTVYKATYYEDRIGITLKIENLEKRDSGWYECKVQTENNQTSIIKVNLIVADPPPIYPYLTADLYPAFYQLQTSFDIIWHGFLQKIRKNDIFKYKNKMQKQSDENASIP